jgi:putative ABC transport system substrate-binding protein
MLEDSTMWRSTLGLLITFGFFVAPLSSTAQSSGKVARIGWLLLPAPPAPGTWIPSPIEAFRQEMRQRGYAEGENLILEFRFAEGREERLAALAADLVRARVDVIVASGTQAIQAARHATDTIPIVMAVSGDPVGTGLIASLARPGGNITGLAHLSSELSGKRLELLREVVPQASRVALLWNPADPPRVIEFRETQMAAQALGIQPHSLEVHGPHPNIEGAFEAATSARAEAVLVLGDSVLNSYRTQIVALAAKSQLPAMYSFRLFADTGGLMAYAPNLTVLYRRAAHYVDKILQGAKPADLPVEQPTKFELVLNLKTAQALGLTFPPHLLVFADEMIR